MDMLRMISWKNDLFGLLGSGEGLLLLSLLEMELTVADKGATPSIIIFFTISSIILSGGEGSFSCFQR